MSGASIRIDGADEAMKALGDAAQRAAQPRDLFDAIGELITASTQNRFEQEKGPDGNPWPPSWRALNEGGKTLTDTGYLAGSITHEADDSGVAVGTNVIYAAIHQVGGTIKPVSAEALTFNIGGQTGYAQSVTIPARPFLGLDDDDLDDIEAAAAAWIGVDLAEVSHAGV